MTTENFETLKVLVVDDDTFMLDVITATLNGIGVIDVKAADSGRDAIALLDESGADFDVVMCDLYMPDMDGIEFLSHTKDNGFDGNVVLFSGVNRKMLEQAEELALIKQIKVLGSLEKPITQEALKSLLSQVGS
jgi:CheY-like chemotaxis protein